MKRVALVCALVVVVAQQASAQRNVDHEAIVGATSHLLAMAAPSPDAPSAPPPPSPPTTTCVRAAPEFKVNTPTTVSVPAGAQATFTIELTNTDSSGCAASTFNLTALAPPGWTATFSSSVLPFAGGGTVWSVMTVTSPATAAAGGYTVGVTVSDDANPAHAATAPATYIVASTVGLAEDVRFSGVGRELRAELLRPPGAGPFPAVVLLHSCLGFTPHVRVWAEDLRAAGYLTLAVDSFGSRQARDCTSIGTLDDAVQEVTGDAVAALVYLTGLPVVNRTRIGMVGWSLGGMVASRLAGVGTGYRAAAAFYPGCDPYLGPDVVVPLLLLLGGDDALTPAMTCLMRATFLRESGRPVDFQLYPGAQHGFDMEELLWLGGAVADMAYQAAARVQSRMLLLEFLQQRL